jgi:hypothetical protein
MGKNFITAAEAKNLNKTTDKLISQAFKCIKNEAEYGYSEFIFDTYRISLVAFNNLRDELINAGFKLSFNYPDFSEESDTFKDGVIEGKVPVAIKIAW